MAASTASFVVSPAPTEATAVEATATVFPVEAAAFASIAFVSTA